MKFLVVVLLFVAVYAGAIAQDTTDMADGEGESDGMSEATGDVAGAEGSNPIDEDSELAGVPVGDELSPIDTASGQTDSLTAGEGYIDSSESESE